MSRTQGVASTAAARSLRLAPSRSATVPRDWDFRSPGRGDIDFEEIIRTLDEIGYSGPLSVEWEDSGMDRERGAAEALSFVRLTELTPSSVAFDTAMQGGPER